MSETLTARERFRLLEMASADGLKVGRHALALLQQALDPLPVVSAPTDTAPARLTLVAEGEPAAEAPAVEKSATDRLAEARAAARSGRERIAYVLQSGEMFATAGGYDGERWVAPRWTTQLRESALYDSEDAGVAALRSWQTQPALREAQMPPPDAAVRRRVVR